jgi:hypothetical protein
VIPPVVPSPIVDPNLATGPARAGHAATGRLARRTFAVGSSAGGSKCTEAAAESRRH